MTETTHFLSQESTYVRQEVQNSNIVYLTRKCGLIVVGLLEHVTVKRTSLSGLQSMSNNSTTKQE